MISLFLLPMIASALAAGSLSLMGRHLILRRLGFYLLPLHQLCVFNASVLAMISFEGASLRLTAAALSSVLFVISLRSSWVRSEHGLLVIYVILMAFNLFLMRLSPDVELSLSQSIFGDIALLGSDLSLLLILMSLIALSVLGVFHRQLLRVSFEKAVYGHSSLDQGLSLLEMALGLFVAFCLLEMGFLFSTSALIVAPLILSSTFLTWKWMTVLSFLCSATGTFVGFWISTQFEQVASTPAAVLAICLFSGACALVRRKLTRSR